MVVGRRGWVARGAAELWTRRTLSVVGCASLGTGTLASAAPTASMPFAHHALRCSFLGMGHLHHQLHHADGPALSSHSPPPSQFFAIEHANASDGGLRAYVSTNYTIVANASEVGEWTPPKVGGAETLRLGR